MIPDIEINEILNYPHFMPPWFQCSAMPVRNIHKIHVHKEYT